MGDGTIGLILSSEGLLKSTGIVGKPHPTEKALSKVQTERESRCTPQPSVQTTELLLFRVGSPSLYAIPSQTVYRIEEIIPTSVKTSGGFQVIPYRNSILTLLNLDELLGGSLHTSLKTAPRTLQAIVTVHEGHFFGLV